MVGKRFLDTYEINSSSGVHPGKMVPLTAGDRTGNLCEKGDCSLDAHSPLVHLMGVS